MPPAPRGGAGREDFWVGVLGIGVNTEQGMVNFEGRYFYIRDSLIDIRHSTVRCLDFSY